MPEKETQDPLQILKEMQESFVTGGRKVQVPPPSFLDMKGEILAYTKNKTLRASFPVTENQTNPLGFMQGGYIAAAFDNTFGPLSFLVAKKPTTTIDMNIHYIRPVETNQKIQVLATVEAKGFSTIHMKAEMWSEKEKLLATATTNLLILKIPSSH